MAANEADLMSYEENYIVEKLSADVQAREYVTWYGQLIKKTSIK